MSLKTDAEVFELMCYYDVKENGARSFSVKKMLVMYEDAGIKAPDVSSLKKEINRYVSFRPHGIEGTVRFRKDAFRSLEKAYGHLWDARAADATVNGKGLRLKEFVDHSGLMKKADAERFELLSYYLFKERGMSSFHVRNVFDLFDDAEIVVADRSALKKHVKECGTFRTVSMDGAIAFMPDALRTFNRDYERLWDFIPETNTAVEIIPEERFCGKRETFDRLIVQINETYGNGSYDACASVMRRLLEAALILSFRSVGKENDILRDGRFVHFDELMKKAYISFPSLNADDLEAASKIGDYSHAGPMYTFGANDINLARNAYRNVLDTLFRFSDPRPQNEMKKD
ncbi:MAG: hypothetical protein FWD92_03385 [Methanomassiliicoccaceae archaeon]|nr:hypothetical protein [Methanomassiliicoccaceae archaeon]